MADSTHTEPSELRHRASDLAKDATNELVGRANERGKAGLTALGNRIDEAASALEQRAAEDDRLPAERVAQVTDGMHSAASYLREKDPRGVLTDIDGAIQRHPYRAIAIGAAVGWVVGRLMSRD